MPCRTECNFDIAAGDRRRRRDIGFYVGGSGLGQVSRLDTRNVCIGPRHFRKSEQSHTYHTQSKSFGSQAYSASYQSQSPTSRPPAAAA